MKEIPFERSCNLFEELSRGVIGISNWKEKRSTAIGVLKNKKLLRFQF